MPFQPNKKAKVVPTNGGYSRQLTDRHFVTRAKKADSNSNTAGLEEGQAVLFNLLSYDINGDVKLPEAYKIAGRKCTIMMGTSSYDDIPVYVPDDVNLLNEWGIVDDAKVPLTERKATSAYFMPVFVRCIVNYKKMTVIEEINDVFYMQFTAGQWGEIQEIFGDAQNETDIEEGSLPPYSLMLQNRSKADRGQDISPYKISAVKRSIDPDTGKLGQDPYWQSDIGEWPQEELKVIEEQWDLLLTDMKKGYELLTSEEKVKSNFAHYRTVTKKSSDEDEEETSSRTVARTSRSRFSKIAEEEEEQEPNLEPDRVTTTSSDEDEEDEAPAQPVGTRAKFARRRS